MSHTAASERLVLLQAPRLWLSQDVDMYQSKNTSFCLRAAAHSSVSMQRDLHQGSFGDACKWVGSEWSIKCNSSPIQTETDNREGG